LPYTYIWNVPESVMTGPSQSSSACTPSASAFARSASDLRMMYEFVITISVPKSRFIWRALM
jgi:hypothetical protein